MMTSWAPFALVVMVVVELDAVVVFSVTLVVAVVIEEFVGILLLFTFKL